MELPGCPQLCQASFLFLAKSRFGSKGQSSLVTVYNQSNNMKTLLLLSILGLALVCAEVKTAEDQHIEEAEVVPMRRSDGRTDNSARMSRDTDNWSSQCPEPCSNDDSGHCEEITDKENPRRNCRKAKDSRGQASCMLRDNKCTEMSCIEHFDSCVRLQRNKYGPKSLDSSYLVSVKIMQMCSKPLAKCVRELERLKCPVVGFP